VNHHRSHGGMSRFDKFRYYHQEFLHLYLNDQQVADLSREFSRLVVDEVIAAKAIPGANQFLENLCVRKKICAVNSATPLDEIREIVNRRCLSQYFTEVLGSPETKLSNLKRLISNNNANVENVVFFGDAMSDYNAAIQCKVDFVGVGDYVFKHHKKLPLMKYAIRDFLQVRVY